MGNVLKSEHVLTVDWRVIVVTHEEAGAEIVRTDVLTVDPLAVRVLDEPSRGFAKNQRVLLVAPQAPEGQYTALVKIRDVRRHGNEVMLCFEEAEWRCNDRRRADRKPINVPAILAHMGDAESGPVLKLIQGRTLDISRVGAWIQSEEAIERGALLEVRLDLPQTSIRALGIVMRVGEGWCAVEFESFLGNGEKDLASFLEAA